MVRTRQRSRSHIVRTFHELTDIDVELLAEKIDRCDIAEDVEDPSRTLMAHLGKDSYSHIHYDSEQARTISVREAARLQSFPDGFTFNGSMNSAFRQIGNAVPPLLAYQIGLTLMNIIQNAMSSTVVTSDVLAAAE
jgi:site-specific DNA-cytosine methylase